MSGHFAGRGNAGMYAGCTVGAEAGMTKRPYGSGSRTARRGGRGELADRQPKDSARRRSPSEISSGVCVVKDIRSVAGSGSAA